MKIYVGLVLCFSVILVSCTNEEGDRVVTDGPEWEDLYFDYHVNGEEGRPDATCIFQYRLFDVDGDAVPLPTPGSVWMDGRELAPDSANFTGVYYEVNHPLESFSGMHVVRARLAAGKEYSDTFHFQPMVLRNDLPEVISRDHDISLSLAGLDPVDYIRVVATDTSFRSIDINQLDTVRNGQLTIPRDLFWKLADGPIMLLLTRERYFNLGTPDLERGRLTVNYSLQRIFELQE